MCDLVPEADYTVHCVLEVLNQEGLSVCPPFGTECTEEFLKPLRVGIRKPPRALFNKPLQRGRAICSSVLLYELDDSLLKVTGN